MNHSKPLQIYFRTPPNNLYRYHSFWKTMPVPQFVSVAILSFIAEICEKIENLPKTPIAAAQIPFA